MAKVLNFPTMYTKKDKVKSKVGKPIQELYKMKVDKDGVRTLVKEGKVDIYSQIQSYKDSCDINVILKRFANGDETALSKVQGIYGDFTQMPTTLQELQQRVIDAEHYFLTLPLDVRKEFNHSASEFFASIGTDKFNDIFKDKLPTLETPDVVVPDNVVPIEKGVVVNE